MVERSVQKCTAILVDFWGGWSCSCRIFVICEGVSCLGSLVFIPCSGNVPLNVCGVPYRCHCLLTTLVAVMVAWGSWVAVAPAAVVLKFWFGAGCVVTLARPVKGCWCMRWLCSSRRILLRGDLHFLLCGRGFCLYWIGGFWVSLWCWLFVGRGKLLPISSRNSCTRIGKSCWATNSNSESGGGWPLDDFDGWGHPCPQLLG